MGTQVVEGGALSWRTRVEGGMRRRGAIAVVAAVLVTAASGCGSGTTTVVKTVTTPAPSPPVKLVLARHDPEAPQHESGAQEEARNGCRTLGGGRVKTILLRSETAGCYRVAPRNRLLFVNETGLGPERGEPNPVAVQLGDYRATIGVGKSALFPPVGTYLRLGLHLVYTNATVQRPSIQVLPEGCSFDHTKPGESLCFAPGAPPCRSSALGIHAGRGGAAAGTDYEHLLIVNRSGRTCTLAGFPRVTPVDAAGRPLDAPFPTSDHATTMSGNHPRTIALEPGAIATFEMNSGTATNFPRSTCRPRKAAALEVTIPGAGGPPLPLPSGLEICADETNVSVGRIE
jgi:Protein of unknown function (DUF4232)